MSGKSDNLFKFIEGIHRYYPVGIPYLNDVYPGYKELLAIIEKKILTLQDEKPVLPWAYAVEEIKQAFPDHLALDMAYLQFPNLKLSIALSDEQDGYFKKRSSLVLCISLLVDYFTIYFEDTLITDYYMGLSMVHYWRNATNKKENEEIQMLKKIISCYYPDIIFSRHDNLCKTKIHAVVPHGEYFETAKPYYRIYDLLFDTSHINHDVQAIYFDENKLKDY